MSACNLTFDFVNHILLKIMAERMDELLYHLCNQIPPSGPA